MADHPYRKLGRRPPKGAPALRLASVLTGAVPDHPAAADNLSRATYGLYGNDQFGDCGPVSVANSRRLTTAVLSGGEADPALADVFDLYRRSGNPDFDPATGADDDGVDMQTMLEAVHAGGIGGTRSVAFARVDHRDLDEVRAAVAIFGFVLFGVDLELAQQTQTDTGVWDYRKSAEWGGHAVLAAEYQPGRTGVVTWAERVEATDAFLGHQLGEAWVVVWPEHLRSRSFLTGVDMARLAAAYQELTGRPLPTSPPTPADPDHLLAVALRRNDWVGRHHVGDNGHVAEACRGWLAAKGL